VSEPEAERGPGEEEAPLDEAGVRREQLIEVYREASGCTKCPLAETRTKVVFGAGDANADLMFVGEAPGADEDQQGLPFVGRAGQLLNQLLQGIGLSREQVFITNVLKSRPPGNRDPQPLEIEACQPYLWRQVELIQPRVVATLGNFATKLITKNPTGITRVRGVPQVHTLGGRTVFVFPLLHPAAALRTPKMKETLTEDFRRLEQLLSEPLPDEPEQEWEEEGLETHHEPRPPSGQGSKAPDTEQLDIFRPS
jgi:uracil-DNA glycosylase family 4